MREITHATVGLLVAKALGLNPWYVLAGALIPDLDYVAGHRELLHNVFVVGLLLWMNPAVGIGAVTHILLDMVTKHGVALFWPISRKTYGLKLFKTGGIVDWGICLAAALLLLAGG